MSRVSACLLKRSHTAAGLSLLIPMVLTHPAQVRVSAPTTAPAEYSDHQLVIDELNCNRKRFVDT